MMNDIKVLFGARIKELRKKMNLTQAQLAEMVNVDNKHISCIEAGKSFPSSELIYRFSRAFSTEVKELFEFSHLNSPKNLKEDIQKMMERLSDGELILAYKYIKTFLL